MEIKYKLLGEGEWVILTRHPQLVNEKLCVCFDGVPQNSTAVFTSNGTSYYRKLEGNVCELPAKKLDGVVSVTIAVFDGKIVAKRWQCEELLIKKQKNGDLFVLPNDMNIPEKFVDLLVEFDEMKARIVGFENDVKDLNKRLLETEEVYVKAIKELYKLIKNYKYN